MDLNIENSSVLLLISAVVAMLCRRLRLPYSVGLVLAGIALAFVPFAPAFSLTKELLFTVLLPPLIFEAAFDIRWDKLRKDLAVVLTLATVGVAISAGIAMAGMYYLAGWPWQTALIFGVLIAATDPVSVIATFKEASARGRLLLLIESESLFNDGTAAVLFAICLELVLGRSMTPLAMAGNLVFTIAGSLVCGAFVAGVALLIAGRTDDHLVEITFTTVSAYGSFLFAEHLGLSGVLATLMAGLFMGNIGDLSSVRRLGVISDRGREAVQAFWEYAAFVSNSFIFLLIGMREAHQNFLQGWQSFVLAILVVTVGRAFSVYGSCALFSWSKLRVTRRHQYVLFWGGLRGALALALALGLPEELPNRDAVVTATFAIVAFSVFVQGFTLTPLLKNFDEIPGKPARLTASTTL